MSKADDILRDELDPEDLNPSPRGGKNGRDQKRDSARLLLDRMLHAWRMDVDSVPFGGAR